jgi:preprotein translocase SecE subunit
MAESIQEKREARRQRRNEEATDDGSEKGLTEKKGTATPSRRKGEVSGQSSTTGGGNIVTRSFRSVRDYLVGVRTEMEKVTWPDREETNRLTRIVMAVLLASSLFLGGLSILFTEIFNLGVTRPWIFMVVFVAFIGLMFAYARYTERSNSSDF